MERGVLVLYFKECKRHQEALCGYFEPRSDLLAHEIDIIIYRRIPNARAKDMHMTAEVSKGIHTYSNRWISRSIKY